MDQQQQGSDTWVCTGTCQAVISDEEHKNGLVNCGADVCTMKGKPFVKGHKDQASGQNVTDSEEMPAGIS